MAFAWRSVARIKFLLWVSPVLSDAWVDGCISKQAFGHEAVSRLVEKGLSDQEVSAVSGHKSMQMLKRYTHLRAEDLVNKLDAIGI